MAGIAGGKTASPRKVLTMLRAMAHRGTAQHLVTGQNGASLGMLGSPASDQIRTDESDEPLSNENETITLVWDGELYNADELRQTLISRGHQFRSTASAEVLIHLYEEDGPQALEKLDGAFALALDTPDGLLLARDPLGIKPLYVGESTAGNLLFASELRPLLPHVETAEEFPPGHYWTARTGLVAYYELPPITEDACDSRQTAGELLATLRDAVQRTLPAGEPLGVFLSGGLDSSLIAALAAQEWDWSGGPLHSFAVGMEGSEDLERARQVAGELGTDHHEHIFTEDEIIRLLPSVVARLESFDAALVRGAMANFAASRMASSTVQTVLSGEGADELFGGYHYLKRPEIRTRLQEELQYITASLHHTSLQRVDRMTAAHGIEAHLPFLSSKVLELAWRIPAHWKINRDGTEKWILRQAAGPVLPGAVAQRTKAKFATGTGVGPFLESYADSVISDGEFAAEAEEKAAQGIMLASKEECLYFRYFEQAFGDDALQAARLIGRSRSINEDQLNVLG